MSGTKVRVVLEPVGSMVHVDKSQTARQPESLVALLINFGVICILVNHRL